MKKFEHKKEIVIAKSNIRIDRFSLYNDYFYLANIFDNSTYKEFVDKLWYLKFFIERISFQKWNIEIKYRKLNELNFFRFLKWTDYYIEGNKIPFIQKEKLIKRLYNNWINKYIELYKENKNAW